MKDHTVLIFKGLVNNMGMELDVTKSVIISSPAGSGKTEKLARRYISLLKAGSLPERILAITFTEKAAAEMKQRILDILSREEPELLENIRSKIALMRISTIHSFCLKLLKRFSIELGLDPSLSVMDELNARELWAEAIFESLEAEKENPAIFYETMSKEGIRGDINLMRLLNELFSKRPQPELILREGGGLETYSEDEERVLSLYADCLKRYEIKKKQRHVLDFNDLELLTYEALSSHPEWHNILYAFDEHTGHILVDEFQDTSTLQWKIIDKLIEEWRSGIGARRSAGERPTVFLVGDEKQSIYGFRGANVSVFESAKQKFSEWLKEDYQFEEVRDNYRSLPSIVNFVNSLFEKLMPSELIERWQTRYCPFNAVRSGEGDVELVVLESSERTKQNRIKEANLLAKAIKSLEGNYEVYDGELKRPCRFSDMVILLRRRTYLTVFENALRKEGIPFIVQKGIGFFDEPEIAILREFVSFLIDPSDNYSLFNLLRSPLMCVDYKTLLPLMKEEGCLLKKLLNGRDKTLEGISQSLSKWLKRRNEVSISILIEEMLTETSAYTYFSEKQRHANVKRFITMVEAFESCGLSPLQIREKLLRQRYAIEIPKANVNAEGVNAVRIMTVHSAKGLQFLMVFIPSLDEANMPKSFSIAIIDEPEKITLSYEPDVSKRRAKLPFEKMKQKELEEEKRLFYVALTRARDYIFMSGIWGKEKPTGRLSYIADAFGTDTLSEKSASLPFRLLTEEDIDKRYKMVNKTSLIDAGQFIDEPSYTQALQYEPPLRWRDVTEEVDIRAEHGDNWVIIGRVMHRLFDELSKGVIPLEGVKERVRLCLKEEAVETTDIDEIFRIIMDDIEKLKTKGYMDEIILPMPNLRHSFSELPFCLELSKTVFKGRIDRLILIGESALLYDYKTFPIRDKEMPKLIEKYRFQMEVYKSAVQRIFKVKAKPYLLFTHLPELIEV